MKTNRFFILLVGTALLVPLACLGINLPQISRLKGSGNVITETRAVSGFTRVALSSIGELTLIQGNEESLVIEADDNFMPLITSEVRNGTLYIGFKSSGPINLDPTVDIKYTLTMKEVEGLEVSGAANLQTDTVKSGDLQIESSGAGRIQIANLTADRLDVEISGAGDIKIEGGTVPKQVVSLSGAGSYDSSGVESLEMNIDISGAGNATVWVTDKLDVEISGAGNLTYYGTPAVDSNSSGAGHIESLGEK